MTTRDGGWAQLARQRVEAQLVPGAIVKLRREMDDGAVHEKRWVVLSVTTSTVCCVINTEINPIIQRDEARLRVQAQMTLSDHPFMTHDSHVDCGKLWTFETPEVLDELCSTPAWILGTMSEQLRDDMVTCLQTSSTLRPAQTRPLIQTLTALQFAAPAA
jgi:hypothetical protein